MTPETAVTSCDSPTYLHFQVMLLVALKGWSLKFEEDYQVGLESVPVPLIPIFAAMIPEMQILTTQALGGSGKFLHLFWKVSERIVSEIGGSSYPEYCKGPPLTTMDSNSRDSPGTVCCCIRMARETRQQWCPFGKNWDVSFVHLFTTTLPTSTIYNYTYTYYSI